MIKIEITADTAEALAAQLHQFVETFVKLARGTMSTPFDKTPVEEQIDAAGSKQADDELSTRAAARAAELAAKATERKPRTRKTTEVIDNAPEMVNGAAAEAKSDEPSDEEVRELLNKLRASKGNEALGKVVTQFAPRFSEIPKVSYAQLYAVAKRALAS